MSYDTFDFQARTLPVVVALVPAYLCAALLVAEIPAAKSWWNLLPIPVVLALSVLAKHLGRDAGKRIEKALWAEWGGPPTTQKLRWATAENLIIHRDLHQSLQAIVGPNITLPTPAQENADPVGADQIYEAATRVLITRTGQKDTYAKLKNDLVGYCFRRNVYGLRTLACTVASLISLGSIVAMVVIVRVPIDFDLTVPIVALIGSLVWIVLYTLWFTTEWVRRGAEAYADELLKHAPAANP